MRNLLPVLTLVSVSACGVFAPPKSPAAELFDCRAKALESLMGDREAAVTAAREIYAGRKSLTEIVAGLKPARDELQRLLTDLNACDAPDAGAGQDAGPAGDASVEGEVAQ